MKLHKIFLSLMLLSYSLLGFSGVSASDDMFIPHQYFTTEAFKSIQQSFENQEATINIGITISDLLDSPITSVFHFQILISGLFVIIAAGMAWRATTAPLRAERKNKKEDESKKGEFVRLTLESDFISLKHRIIQATDCLTSVGFMDTDYEVFKIIALIALPKLIQDWQFMVLFSEPTFKMIMELKSQIDVYNTVVIQSRNSFTSQHMKQYISGHLKVLENKTDVLISNLSDNKKCLR